MSHSSYRPMVCRVGNTPRPMTKTSASLALNMIDFFPCPAEYMAFTTWTFMQYSQTHYVCVKCFWSLGHSKQNWYRHPDNQVCQKVKQLWLVVIVPQPQYAVSIWGKDILFCHFVSPPLSSYGPCVYFHTWWTVHSKDNVYCHVCNSIDTNPWQKVKGCILCKYFRSVGWQCMDQSWTINKDIICLWNWKRDVFFNNGGQMRLLTAVNLPTIN